MTLLNNTVTPRFINQVQHRLHRSHLKPANAMLSESIYFLTSVSSGSVIIHSFMIKMIKNIY